MSNQLVIVDAANIRERRPQRRSLLGKRQEIEAEEHASLHLLNSLISAIRSELPSSTVVSIADRVLAHRFADTRDVAVYRERTRLPITDPNFIYELPHQGSDSRYRASRRGVRRSDSSTYIEADELILTLARKTDALVVSGDLFRDARYAAFREIVHDRQYIPIYNTAAESWLLCNRNRFINLSSRRQRDPTSLLDIAGLDEVTPNTARFDSESDADLRRLVFDTLIPEFWADLGLDVDFLTFDVASPLTSRPFRGIKLPRRRKPSQIVHATPVLQDTQSRVPVEQVEADSPESEHVLAEAPVRRYRIVAERWASSSISNVQYIDQAVKMVGQLHITDGGTYTLRWILPEGSIAVSGPLPRGVRFGIDVIKLAGVLRQRQGELILDTLPFADQLLERVDLDIYYHKRIDQIRKQHLAPRPRNWSLPALPRLRARTAVNPGVSPLVSASSTRMTSPLEPRPSVPATYKVDTYVPNETTPKWQRGRSLGRYALITSIVAGILLVIAGALSAWVL